MSFFYLWITRTELKESNYHICYGTDIGGDYDGIISYEGEISIITAKGKNYEYMKIGRSHAANDETCWYLKSDKDINISCLPCLMTNKTDTELIEIIPADFVIEEEYSKYTVYGQTAIPVYKEKWFGILLYTVSGIFKKKINTELVVFSDDKDTVIKPGLLYDPHLKNQIVGNLVRIDRKKDS